MRPCWCGHSDFAPFSDDYGRCLNCETLVSLKSLSGEQLAVNDDELDFYGKQYWLTHQATDLGFPDMTQAGYRASGVEVSPWVVSFGSTTFHVPIMMGPIENLEIEEGSLDVIASMDVLEHLADPAATMRHRPRFLSEDGRNAWPEVEMLARLSGHR